VWDSGDGALGANATVLPAAAPHSGQNRAAGGSAWPHWPQAICKRAPHSGQNFAPGGPGCKHWGQFTPHPSEAGSILGVGRTD
jgi:hypothetical protein